MNVWHRYANELVGAVVVGAGIAFLAAVLHAGVLKDWFTPSVTLRLLLPDAGMAGLSVGADVEILGTRAGTVRRIVIDPARQMYAEISLEPQMRVFVRADSNAVIRKRFALDGEEPMTLAELGEVHCLSRERIRQIEKQALKRMRGALRSRGIVAGV